MHAITGYMGTTLTMVNRREIGGVRLSLIRLAMQRQGVGYLRNFYHTKELVE